MKRFLKFLKCYCWIIFGGKATVDVTLTRLTLQFITDFLFLFISIRGVFKALPGVCFLLFNYFHKNLHCRYLTGLQIHLCMEKSYSGKIRKMNLFHFVGLTKWRFYEIPLVHLSICPFAGLLRVFLRKRLEKFSAF